MKTTILSFCLFTSLLFTPAAQALITPPVGGDSGGYYSTRLLYNLAASTTTNRLYYTNSSAAFGDTNTSALNIRSNTSAARWEWRSGTTVLATNTANRPYGVWNANAGGAATYGYTRYEPTALLDIRVDTLGVVAYPTNFWTVNASVLPAQSSAVGSAYATNGSDGLGLNNGSISGIAASVANSTITTRLGNSNNYSGKFSGVASDGFGLASTNAVNQIVQSPPGSYYYDYNFALETNNTYPEEVFNRKGLVLADGNSSTRAGLTNGLLVITNLNDGRGAFLMMTARTNMAWYAVFALTNGETIAGIEAEWIGLTNFINTGNPAYARYGNISTFQNIPLSAKTVSLTSTNNHLNFYNAAYAPSLNVAGLGTEFAESEASSRKWYNPRTRSEDYNYVSNPGHLQKIVTGFRYLDRRTIVMYTSGQPEIYRTLDAMPNWQTAFSGWVESIGNDATLQYVQWCLQSFRVYVHKPSLVLPGIDLPTNGPTWIGNITSTQISNTFGLMTGAVRQVFYKAKASDTGVTNSTTLINDPDLTISNIPSNHTYLLESELHFDAAGTGPGFNLGVQIPACTSLATVSSWRANGGTLGPVGTQYYGQWDTTAASGGVDAANTGVASKFDIRVNILFKPTSFAFANATVRWAQFVSSGTGLQLKAGSWIRLTQLD